MLGSVSISSSSPTMHTDNANAQSSSPRLSGRLRTLSYLRNYSQANANDRSDSSSGGERISRVQTIQPSHRTASSATVLARHNSPSPPTPELRHFRSREPASRASRTVSATASQAATGGWLPSVDGSPGLARTTTQLHPSPVTSRRVRNTSTTAGVSEGHASMAGPRNRSATSPSNVLDLASLRSARRVSHPAGPSLAPPVNPATTQLPTSQLPSIQLVPYQDPRSSRPSLNFNTTTRTLPGASSIIRVGRYSERDSTPAPTSTEIVSDAPVGFKSKVVSRRHCEFFYQNNSWFIKDVRSSSGTFLNHIRLSPPGEESRPYAIKDGDLVQLGIDFKGGEEMIFRCVKIRILCNRGWQKSLNKFNKSAHKRLNDLQRGASKDVEATQNSTECTICLNSIAPCQSLFVAPCSHTWHYKCIRPMLEAASRTLSEEMHFQCPNCRNVADLDADIDEGVSWNDSDEDEDIVEAAELEADPDTTHIGHPLAHVASPEDFDENHVPDLENGNVDSANGLRIGNLTINDSSPSSSPTLSQAQTGLNPDASAFVPSSSFGSTHSTTLGTTTTSNRPTNIALPIRRVPVPILPVLTREAASDSNSNGTSREIEEDDDSDASESGVGVSVTRATTLAGPFKPSLHPHLGLLPSSASPPPEGETEGPLTPRNNAGPFVFDGGAGLAVAEDDAASIDVGMDDLQLDAPRRNGFGRVERDVDREGRSKRRAVHGEGEVVPLV